MLSLKLISWGCKSSASPLKDKVALKFKVQSLSAPSHNLLIPRNPKPMRRYLQPRLTVKTRCMLTLLAQSWTSFQTSLRSWDSWTRCLEPFYIYFQLFCKVSSKIFQLPKLQKCFVDFTRLLIGVTGADNDWIWIFMWVCPFRNVQQFHNIAKRAMI